MKVRKVSEKIEGENAVHFHPQLFLNECIFSSTLQKFKNNSFAKEL